MALDTQQIDELVRLRCEERLSQRDIAERLGVGRWTVKQNWHLLPDEYQKQLPEAQQARCETMLEARRRRSRERDEQRRIERAKLKNAPKCPVCEFCFTDDNPRVQGGWCALCELQALGHVVLYTEVA